MLKRLPSRSMLIVSSIFILSFLCCGLCLVSHAQGNSPASANRNAPPNQPADRAGPPPYNLENAVPPPTSAVTSRYLTSPEVVLTLMVILLALVTLMMQFLLLKRTSKLRAEDTLRVFGVTLILMGTLFFITAGFSSAQIAPATGLFGTIAGYLLGKMEKKERKENEGNA